MTTKMRQRRGHTGSTFYNWKGAKHGRTKGTKMEMAKAVSSRRRKARS